MKHHDGFPDKFNILGNPITDRIIDAGLHAGRIIRRVVSFLPPNAPDFMSEHYKAPGESTKAFYQAEYARQDLLGDVEQQTGEHFEQ